MKPPKSKPETVVYYPSEKRSIENRFYQSGSNALYFSCLGSSQDDLAVYETKSIEWTPNEREMSDWFRRAIDATISFAPPKPHGHHFATTNFPASFENLITNLQRAITDYLEFKHQFESAPPPSKSSAQSFLFLIPALAPYEPHISIDSTNGCVNLSIHAGKSGVLTSQISSDGKVYYSLAGRGERIYKITGTAKFKTARDHLQFRKVLNLL